MTQFLIKIVDVEHGACTMLSPLGATGGGLAMIDCGHNVSPILPEELHNIKLQGGAISEDMAHYLEKHRTFTGPIPIPFEQNMGGASAAAFFNSHPEFTDTNNLSLVVFVKMGWFKILFPGDLESDGWIALLRQPDFVSELANTTILIASHHGRLSGFCGEISNHFTPRAIVISDKSVQHATQEFVT
jgi:hypothetical protein